MTDQSKKMGNNKISPDLINKYYKEIHDYSNSGSYKKAYALSLKLSKKYPNEITFAYLEAVFSAEDPRGLTKKEITARYKNAANKLKGLLHRLKGVDLKLSSSIRNEYYWFSRQPKKQYLLGVEMVRKGLIKAYYSQGVGAVEVAQSYGLLGQKSLCLRWAKRSEKAWEKYIQHNSNWFNSYLFYAKALGFQEKNIKMKAAFKKASQISGLSLNDESFLICEKNIEAVQKALRER